MRKSRFTEEQIIGILKEGEAGSNISELCRKHGISKESYYRWKAKFGGCPTLTGFGRVGDEIAPAIKKVFPCQSPQFKLLSIVLSYL